MLSKTNKSIWLRKNAAVKFACHAIQMRVLDLVLSKFAEL